MKIYKFLLIVLVQISLLSAQGTTSGEILKLPSGGALYGTDFISFNGFGGSQQSFFHPAGVINSNRMLLSTYYSNIAFDTDYFSAIAVIPLSSSFSAGIGFRMLSIGGIPRFTQVGVPDGTIDAGSYSIPLILGYSFSDKFSFGIKVNYISEILDNFTANTFGISAGIELKNTGIQGFRFRGSVLNAGGKLTFYREKEPLPFGFMGTIMYMSPEYPLGFVTHILKFRDEKLRLLVGLEYNYQGQFFVRTQYHVSELQEKGWSTGIGVNLGQMSLSYDYIPSSTLQDRHAISFTVRMKPKGRDEGPRTLRQPMDDANLTLPAPENLEYMYQGGKLIVSWDYSLLDFPGATFEVYVSKKKSGPWHKLPYKNLQARSIEFEPQSRSMTIYFKVRAFYQDQVSPDSKILEIKLNY